MPLSNSSDIYLGSRLPTLPRSDKNEEYFVKGVVDALSVPTSLNYDSTWEDVLRLFGEAIGLSTAFIARDSFTTPEIQPHSVILIGTDTGALLEDTSLDLDTPVDVGSITVAQLAAAITATATAKAELI